MKKYFKLNLNNIPATNFYLSILIVFHHAFNMDITYMNYDRNSEFYLLKEIERYMYNFSEISVPIFFFISAYLFYINYTFSLTLKKWKNRFFSLVVPYVLYNFVGYVLHCFMDQNQFDILDMIISIWKSEFLPLWFIRELCVFSLLAPIFLLLFEKLYVLFVLCIPCGVLIDVLGFFSYDTFLYWIPIYFLGILFAKKSFKEIASSLKEILIPILSIVVFIYPIFMPNNTRINFHFNLVYIIYRILVITWFLLIQNTKFYRQKNIYHYSFFIYCTHFFALRFFQIIFNKIFEFTIYKLYFSYFGSVILSIIVIIICASLLEKKMPVVFYILNGRRERK